jgi:type VI secretion system protein ImpI
VEQALEPRAVAAALLDWRDDAADAPTAVENILADLMLHHLALSQGVMEGTHVLLDELSPARVEAENGPTPSMLARVGLGPPRERALWEAYVERHAEFEAGGEAFRDAFGVELTKAYAAHWGRGGGESSTR